jgi:hypothetical protein
MKGAIFGAIALTTPVYSQTTFETLVKPFVSAYCYTCHNEKVASGGLNLKTFTDSQRFVEGREQWQRVTAKLQSGEMPPKGIPRPPADRVAEVIKWLNGEFDRQDRQAPLNPGRVTARRLNRFEYSATIRDLLDVDFRAADSFPADEFGYGFDNIGDVLSLSPALMEKYLSSAKKIARAAIDPPETPKHPGLERNKNVLEAQPFTWVRNFPWEGDYDLRLATPYYLPPYEGHDPGTLFLTVDDEPVRALPLPTDGLNEGAYIDVRLHLTAGMHRLSSRAERDVAACVESELKKQQQQIERAKKIVADADKPPVAAPADARESKPPTKGANGGGFSGRPVTPAMVQRMRELLAKGPPPREEIEQTVRKRPQIFTEFIEVRGPYNPLPAPRPAGYRRVFVCGHEPGHHTDACVRTNLEALAARAWRRPVTAPEIAKLVSFVRMAQNDGQRIDEAMKVGVTAILVAPDFLFRIEPARESSARGDIRRLGPYELATRLSYFLWSSMPDDELFRLAKSGEIENPAVLDAQVDRMLKDPKAEALVDNFGAQWLETRNLDTITPDPDKFLQANGGPGYCCALNWEALRESMKQETRRFLLNIMFGDATLPDLLTAKYTYVNERLAKYYGIEGVKGDEFRKVSLQGTPRMGLLTQASILTVSSYPTRTSPVVRGKWILENILNAPPPPPPPNVPSLEASAGKLSGTLRQQLELHRADAVCASCHSKMDPLGFGLENFDAIGRWRTKDGDFPIDARGVLPNGQTFSGPQEMIEILARDKDAIAHCVTEKLLTFALGRGLEAYDRPAVNEIVRSAAAGGYKFSSVVHGIVHSAPFQMRKGVASASGQTAAVTAKPKGPSR